MSGKIRPYLGDKEFYKKVATIAIPIAMQSLITIGVNLMDTIMLGDMGEIQLSASSLANQFIMVFHICCMGIGMGASVLTARFWGMGDMPSLKKAITIMIRFGMVVALLFTAASVIMPDMIMRIYTEDTAMIEAGVRYIKWIVPTYIFLGLSLFCTIVLRSIGNVRIPLICSVFSFFINVFFNWVFIYGNLGAPRMEIEGAALGTLIARAFEFIFICGYFFLIEKKITYRIKDLFMKCSDILGDYIRYGIPVFVSDLLLALGNNSVAMIMGRIGALFVSANAITAVVMQISTVFIQGISNASAIMTGHTLGEGDTEKAQRQGFTFAGLGLVIGIAAGGIIALISWPVINFYNVTDETKLIAEQLMLALGVVVVFQSLNSILTKGVLRAGGDTKFLMVADVLFLWVASIPLGYIAGLVFNLEPFWIFIALRIDQIIKAVWCVFRLRSKKWIKKI